MLACPVGQGGESEWGLESCPAMVRSQDYSISVGSYLELAHGWASSVYLRHWNPQDLELSMTWKDTGSCLQEHRGRLQLP